VPDNPRIEELRRRVQTDPASIAFAQLAEEYRRAGSYQEAIAACDAGLKIHPGYLSARVTLGRALIEVNDLDVAEVELRQVLQIASENLAAIRGLAEIYHRRGQLPEALRFYQSALVLAKHDPDLEQTVAEISRALTTEPAPVEDDGMSFAEAQAEFLAALEGFEALGAAEHEESLAESELSVPAEPESPEPVALGPLDPAEPEEPVERIEAPVLVGAGAPETPELYQLERFLDAIHTYRQRRAV